MGKGTDKLYTTTGVYTMETIVHADDPAKVLRNFYRRLRPGGVLVMHEADFKWDSSVLQDVLRLSHCQNTLKQSSYEELLRDAGFKDISVDDLSENVLPLWRLFGFVGAVFYEICRLFELQHRFTNTMAGECNIPKAALAKASQARKVAPTQHGPVRDQAEPRTERERRNGS